MLVTSLVYCILSIDGLVFNGVSNKGFLPINLDQFNELPLMRTLYLGDSVFKNGRKELIWSSSKILKGGVSNLHLFVGWIDDLSRLLGAVRRWRF